MLSKSKFTCRCIVTVTIVLTDQPVHGSEKTTQQTSYKPCVTNYWNLLERASVGRVPGKQVLHKNQTAQGWLFTLWTDGLAAAVFMCFKSLQLTNGEYKT